MVAIAPAEPITAAQTSCCYRLRNCTARRIAIAGKEGCQGLILSQFGMRDLRPGEKERYDIAPWEQYNLVTVKRVNPKAEKRDLELHWFCQLHMALFPLTMLVLLVLLLTTRFRESQIFWLVVGLLVLGHVALFIFVTRGRIDSEIRASFRNWLEREPRSWVVVAMQRSWQSLNLLLFALIGVIVPVMLAYPFDKVNPNNLPESFLRIGFIITASMLPALWYFLFTRIHLDAVRERFTREVIMVDPNIVTLDEAETKYGLLVDTVYGADNVARRPLGANLPILISTLAMTTSWLFVFSRQFDPASTPPVVQTNLLFQSDAFTYGFFGFYFFAVTMLFRRYVLADLTPKAYSHVTYRFLTTTIVVWTVSALPLWNGTSDVSKALLYATAFVIGVIPDTGVALIVAFARRHLGKVIPSLQEDHPVTRLEGLTLYDRARLEEEGIQNVENLAHHLLPELMLRTPLPTGRIVDLFDQAILYLHLGLEETETKNRKEKDGKEKIASPSARQILRDYGIRTATDLEQAYRSILNRAKTEKVAGLAEKELADFLGLLDGLDDAPVRARTPSLPRVRVILDALADDDWMTYLREWRDSRLDSKPVTNPCDFYHGNFGPDPVSAAPGCALRS